MATNTIMYIPRSHGHPVPEKTKPAPIRFPNTRTKVVPRCRFLELATELRLNIYDALFLSNDGVRLIIGGNIVRRCKGNEKIAAILSTCWTIFREGRRSFHDCMNFRINVITTHALRSLQKAQHTPTISNMIYSPTFCNIRNMTIDFHLVHEQYDAAGLVHDMASPLVFQINQLRLKTLQINLTVSVGVHQNCFDAFTGVLRHLRCTGVVTSGKLAFSGGGYKDDGGFRRARYPNTSSWTEMLFAIGG